MELSEKQLNLFFKRVNKTPGGCWLWPSQTKDGYGQFFLNGKNIYAHRISYELHVGPIPSGLQIDHLCKVRNCINPAHLEAVTLQENVRRSKAISVLNKLKTHCPAGHPYDKTNTTTQKLKNGLTGRKCRICKNAVNRNYRLRLKAY